MISRLPLVVQDKELLVFTFGMIFDYIEIWDDVLQICLAKSIEEIFRKEAKGMQNLKEIINLLLRFCMKMISTEVNNVLIYKLD